jgi:hypothetical protein
LDGEKDENSRYFLARYRNFRSYSKIKCYGVRNSRIICELQKSFPFIVDEEDGSPREYSKPKIFPE